MNKKIEKNESKKVEKTASPKGTTPPKKRN